MHPMSVSEKMAGSIIQILGSTIFSIVMSSFIQVVMTDKASLQSNKED